jgi:hypothetical protein
MHIACRTAHPVPHAPWQHRAATWLRHIVCLDACILPFGSLATRCTTSGGASCSARRACAAVQHSASRWGCPFGNRFERRVHTSLSGRMRRAPYTNRRSMRAPHRARHLSAVPHRATYHATARGAQLALGARTALLFEMLPPLNVTAPSIMLTTPPPPAPCAQAGAATPIAIGPAPRPPTPAPARIRPDVHRRPAANAH